VDLDPYFILARMVLAEPAMEALRVLEFMDIGGIDLDGRHWLILSYA
jgi:hypothetical protein